MSFIASDTLAATPPPSGQSEPAKGTAASARPFALKTLGNCLIVCALIGVLAASASAAAVVLVLLMAWCFLGSRQSLQALSLKVVVLFLNPALFHLQGAVGLLGWGVVAAAGLRIFFDSLRARGRIHPVLPWFLLFAAVVLLESLFCSEYVSISVFKLLSFTYATAAVLLGFRVTARRGVDWRPWFLGLWLAVFILSVPTWFIPQIGFRTNGHGFQGILNHPQAYAAFLAPMVAFVTGELLFSPARRRDYWLYPVLPAAWVCLFLTEARTALIAVVAGFAVIMLIGLCKRADWRRWLLRGFSRPIVVILVLAAAGFALARPDLLAERISAFIHKGHSAQTVETSFMQSRGAGIAQQWDVFKEHPLYGIGFGVSLERTFRPVLDPILGLPISAPVEKGFLPTAILHETGLLGTAFFVLFLLALLRFAGSGAGLVMLWMFMTCLFVNVGEMIFFSPGGEGLYIWPIMGWASCARWEKKRHAP